MSRKPSNKIVTYVPIHASLVYVTIMYHTISRVCSSTSKNSNYDVMHAFVDHLVWITLLGEGLATPLTWG